MAASPARRRSLIGLAGSALAILVALLIIGMAGIASWEYTNSDAFCAEACHGVHPEEPEAHQASQHSQVTCVECHIGRLGIFHAMLRKVGHSKHLVALLGGHERPVTSPSMPAARESCEGCHSQQPHQHDSIRVRRHFAPDRENTETAVGVILRTAVDPVRDQGRGVGIHWHVENPVHFRATDPARTQISWVQVTVDGTTRTYTDDSQAALGEKLDDDELLTMDCIDCHNRVGHPFEDPEEVVDKALASGDINPAMPFVKARAVELLKQPFSSEDEAKAAVKAAWDRYQKDFPEAASAHPEWFRESSAYMEQRQAFALQMLVNSRFRDPDVSWRSFPDHGGHRYSPGCFRCHDGRHLDDNGTPIRVNCTLCHSIPIIMNDDVVPAYFLATLTAPKPDSHNAPDFLKFHLTGVDDSCAECHGEIKYGTDNKTFCANSGCHGQIWPELELSAMQ